MALVLADRVKESSTTTGTGTVTLSGADAGFKTFAAVGNGNTTYYCIAHQNSNEFEIGVGTYTASGTTLSRDTVLVSTNSDNKVDFSAGTKDVFVTIPEDKSLFRNSDGVVVLPKYTSGPTHSEGTIFYDETNGALAVYNDESEITLQVGQEEYIRVKNTTGSTITNGAPVYLTGEDANIPTIALASATTEAASYAVGLATHDIENNTTGYVTTRGLVQDLDTSALTEGERIHVSPTAGTVQTAAPTYPYFTTDVGICLISNAATGCIYVDVQNHSFEVLRITGNSHMDGNLTVDGDLIVQGTQTIATTENISIGGAFTYLNAGDTIGATNTAFTGSGLDDGELIGHFEGTTSTTYYVKIDATGTPDTFSWSKDNFSTTEATGVSCSTSGTTLDSGIKVKFNATTGHTVGDIWSGTAAPSDVDTGIFSNRNTGGSGVGYTHVGLFFDISSSKWVLLDEYDPEPTGTIDLTDSSVSYATIKADTFEGNASTATTLATTRTFALTGDVTGSATFNGSANASIAATVTTANFSLTDFTNDISEVTTTTPTDASGKPNGYVWYVVS